MLWGLFNQNLFTHAGDSSCQDVNVSILQPIFNYSLPYQWSVGTSEMNITYDWQNGQWLNLPLGLKTSKLQKISQLPVQFAGSYEYNFADHNVVPAWVFNFTVKFLLPL